MSDALQGSVSIVKIDKLFNNLRQVVKDYKVSKWVIMR